MPDSFAGDGAGDAQAGIRPLLAAGISVDTRKLEVAQAVFKVCVPITNDITGLSDVHMAEVEARYHASLLSCIARLLQIRCNESHYMTI